MSLRTSTMKSQAGFTLVELAIVMIIIGLLIGGVLKGQELIGNAQVTATVAQIKGIEAATSTFKDTYASLPGDILTPTTRLPNCSATTVCGSAGNGNGRLDNLTSATPNGTEGERFFVHLNAANLLTGIVPAATGTLTNYPQAKVSGNFIQAGGALANTDLAAAVDNTAAATGLYLVITSTIGVPATANVGLKPSEALRIDTKLDDGIPGTGVVRALGANSATAGCGTGGEAGLYSTSLAANFCGLYVKIQS